MTTRLILSKTARRQHLGHHEHCFLSRPRRRPLHPMSEGHTERLDSALDGKYRIERKLGEGGMASVYLAEDIKHKRKVALKILRPELAAVIGGERFVTEITTTANLQHPHILPLFDSGAADGYLYYVMPFIDGETLGGKLEREKQLGVDEAVRIARDVADALDYAHRNGVIHRDIKPANILLHDGRPVVADFGIALAISAAGGGRMTETGLSLGTPHYMSPEQASADRDLSARSDIYSLGCVLYEMIAGQPPHTGPSAQSILVRILTESPKPLTDLRHTLPPHISAVVAKAIEKLPADRFDSATAFIDALDDTSFTYEPASPKAAAAATPSPTTARHPGPTWALEGVAAAVTAFAGLFIGLQVAAPDSVPNQRSVFEHMVDTSLIVSTACCGSALVVSPDGSRIAHLGRADGRTQIFVRPLEQLRSQPVRGTEGARHARFSYDGTWIAFNNANSLMRIPTEGGQPITVAGGVGPVRDIAWLADNTIVYGLDGDGEGLYRVSADGGAPEQITVPGSAAGERAHRYLNSLPGGSVILMTVMPLEAGEVPRIDPLDLESGERKSLMRGADPWYTDDGHVVYALPDGSIMAQPFDAAALDTIGGPFRIAEGVIYRTEGAGEFGIALNGTMIANGSLTATLDGLVLVDRQGGWERLPLEGSFRQPRFSPDGRLVAVERSSEVQGALDDIWIYDLEQRNPSRLTVEGSNSFPSWSPDGETVMYQKDSPARGSTSGASMVPVSSRSSRRVMRLPASAHPIPSGWFGSPVTPPTGTS